MIATRVDLAALRKVRNVQPIRLDVTKQADVDAAVAEMTIRKQLEQLAQLNEDHPYSYSRDEQVKILDEALACLVLAVAAMVGNPDLFEASVAASERTQEWLDAIWNRR